MNVREFMKQIAGSTVEDWVQISRPTYRHRFTTHLAEEGEKSRIDVDQHVVHYTYRPDIQITMAYGLVEKGTYVIPADIEIARENARTVLLDCYHAGQLIHRETLLKADRQRVILPLPDNWGEERQPVPKAKAAIARLLHTLAGPPTDFDEYFAAAGMFEIDQPWPEMA